MWRLDWNVVMIDVLLFLKTYFMHLIGLKEMLLQAQFILLKVSISIWNQCRSVSELRKPKKDDIWFSDFLFF